MDAWAGGGVDELTLIREADLKIRFPCDERSFLFGPPGVAPTLEPTSYLHGVSPGSGSQGEPAALDLTSCFIKLVSIRSKVLRYEKINLAPRESEPSRSSRRRNRTNTL